MSLRLVGSSPRSPIVAGLAPVSSSFSMDRSVWDIFSASIEKLEQALNSRGEGVIKKISSDIRSLSLHKMIIQDLMLGDVAVSESRLSLKSLSFVEQRIQSEWASECGRGKIHIIIPDMLRSLPVTMEWERVENIIFILLAYITQNKDARVKIEFQLSEDNVFICKVEGEGALIDRAFFDCLKEGERDDIKAQWCRKAIENMGGAWIVAPGMKRGASFLFSVPPQPYVSERLCADVAVAERSHKKSPRGRVGDKTLPYKAEALPPIRAQLQLVAKK